MTFKYAQDTNMMFLPPNGLPTIPPAAWDAAGHSLYTTPNGHAAPSGHPYPMAFSAHPGTASPYAAVMNAIRHSSPSVRVKVEENHAWSRPIPSYMHDGPTYVRPDELLSPSPPISPAQLPGTSKSVVLRSMGPSPMSIDTDDSLAIRVHVDTPSDRPTRGPNIRMVGRPRVQPIHHICDVCGRHFTRSFNLKAHIATHNPNRFRPHACEFHCPLRFVRKVDRIRHENCVHRRVMRFRCDLCHSGFARKDALTRHIDTCSKRPIIKRRQPRKPRRTLPQYQ